jgi:hypothetical protein
MLERTLVKSLGWPKGQLLVLAHEAGTHLAEMGLSGEAILVWLDQVYAEPVKFVHDPALSRLALALLCPHHEKAVNRSRLEQSTSNCTGLLCLALTRGRLPVYGSRT